MEIIPLEDRYADLYCTCLEDWSEEMEEAGDLKRAWLERKKGEGLRVQLAREDSGAIVGMIQYVPIEHAPLYGTDLYYIYCVWVHGYDQGVGNYQGKGIGSMLLGAAETDVRALGAKGIVAWGLRLPFFMRSKWFKKRGYRRIDTDGMLELVWKPFTPEAVAPRLGKLRQRPEKNPGVVTVTCLRNGWCPAQNITMERMKRVAGEFPRRVSYIEIDADKREIFEEWGASDQIFIDDKPLRSGPPRSYGNLRKILARRVRSRGPAL